MSGANGSALGEIHYPADGYLCLGLVTAGKVCYHADARDVRVACEKPVAHHPRDATCIMPRCKNCSCRFASVKLNNIAIANDKHILRMLKLEQLAVIFRKIFLRVEEHMATYIIGIYLDIVIINPQCVEPKNMVKMAMREQDKIYHVPHLHIAGIDHCSVEPI